MQQAGGNLTVGAGPRAGGAPRALLPVVATFATQSRVSVGILEDQEIGLASRCQPARSAAGVKAPGAARTHKPQQCRQDRPTGRGEACQTLDRPPVKGILGPGAGSDVPQFRGVSNRPSRAVSRRSPL